MWDILLIDFYWIFDNKNCLNLYKILYKNLCTKNNCIFHLDKLKKKKRRP